MGSIRMIWCDVTPKSRPVYAHCGVLGMGLLPRFRSQGLGTKLITRTLKAARSFGLGLTDSPWAILLPLAIATAAVVAVVPVTR